MTATQLRIATWSIELTVISARSGERGTLRLAPFWRAQDPESDWTRSDIGWEVFWLGESQTHTCRPNGDAESGSKSILDLLHDFGCVTTSDFGAILKPLCDADLSNVEANNWSQSLSTLINETTRVRKAIPQ